MQTLRARLATNPEPDVRTRLMVDLAAVTDDTTELAELCREAVALNGILVSAASAALMLRRER